MDRKIVQYLIEGKGHRCIKERLGIGSGRLEKVKQLAEQYGYLSGSPVPAYPEALFPDRSDGRTQQRSDTDRLLGEQVGFIEERLNAGWRPITVWEELPITVTRSSFYRFLERHDLMKLARGAKALRVVPEIVHAPGEALILDWGKLCTVLEPVRAVMRTLWVLVGVLGFSRYLMARLVWTNDVHRDPHIFGISGYAGATMRAIHGQRKIFQAGGQVLPVDDAAFEGSDAV